MADNESFIAQFMDVTGVQRDRAVFYMQAANNQLDVALSSFYENAQEHSDDIPPPVAAAVNNSDSSDDEEVMAALPAKKETKSGASRNIATLSSYRDSENKDDEKGQAFYAGGSEHSGQQILGPPKKNPIKDLVSEVFRQAHSGNLEQFDSNESSSSAEGGAHARSSFVGTGYRLGQTEDDSEVVQSTSSRKKTDECDTVTVRVYRQGFTVDDGDLRPYEDPRNREFFESITRNEIPAEFRKQGKSMVHVNVEDHLSEEYVKRAPKFKAFTGAGHTLGSPTPPTTEDVTTSIPSSNTPASNSASNEAKAMEELNVNQSEPTTMISVRLSDGSRLSARFNLTHTVENIRQYITTARPEYSGRPFMLLTTFPNKELANPADTIQQAGLQNAAILQRLK